MSNEAPAFNVEQAKHESLPNGETEKLITAHTEEAPSAEQTAAEKQHMIQEVAPVIAEEAPSKDVFNDYQMQQAAAVDAPIRESKKTVGQRKLKEVQRQLPARDRRLSRIIHQPAIRAVSEVAGSTISRPSGLLGGGIVAFMGSAAYLYFTRYIGIPYNYFVFALLFIGGFALGLLLELLVWSLTASRRRAE